MTGTLDRGYVPAPEALVHCIRGAAWNPIDHLANLHAKLLIREGADEDPSRAWAFCVDHYRMADSVWATIDGAIAPDRHGAIHVTVLHADVDDHRRCENCDTVIGTGVPDPDDWRPAWAKTRPLSVVAPLGALPS